MYTCSDLLLILLVNQNKEKNMTIMLWFGGFGASEMISSMQTEKVQWKALEEDTRGKGYLFICNPSINPCYGSAHQHQKPHSVPPPPGSIVEKVADSGAATAGIVTPKTTLGDAKSCSLLPVWWGSWSAEEAEADSLLKGLRLSLDFGRRNIVLESNCRPDKTTK